MQEQDTFWLFVKQRLAIGLFFLIILIGGLGGYYLAKLILILAQ